jgi:hypothetical protein
VRMAALYLLMAAGDSVAAAADAPSEVLV